MENLTKKMKDTFCSKHKTALKPISINELKPLQLEILETVDSFCRKNGIRYSLCGGTLLGAIRHKGYIPWDDDIDIMMPRPDYERFHDEFNKSSDNSFKMVSAYNNNEFFLPFGKVVNTRTFLKERYDRPISEMGLNIDIFPIDGLPSDKEEREHYWKKVKIEKYISTCLYQKKNKKEHGIKKILRQFLFTIFKVHKGNYFSLKLHARAKLFDFSRGDLIANSIFGYGKKEEMPANLFSSFVDVDFEGRKFCAIADWKTYLSTIFGDYMKLPPKEEQVAKHDFEMYWRTSQ